MRDSGEPDWKCGEVAGQFELKGAYLDGPIAKLSGGWQTRVKLAALLLHEPNLLLLDEPTNFLDLRTQILLEHFLQSHRSACLIVSHDRAFLGATCDHTLDLSRGKLTTFPGKVDAFLEFQREKREHEERSNETILAKRRHLEDFIARNKARASTATLAKSKAKQLERLELTEIASDEPTASIRAPRVEPRKGPALRCRDLAIGYPERQIAADVQLEIDHGSRAAVVGDNGQGKTTFLRTVVDSLKPLAGEVRWGYGCQIGVYAQHVYTSLPEKPDRAGLPAAAGRPRQEGSGDSRSGRRLAVPEGARQEADLRAVRRRARPALSGGAAAERSQRADPRRAGQPSRRRYRRGAGRGPAGVQGTVIFTSHDRHFTKRVATCIVEVRDGRVTNYSGQYEAYLYKVNKEIEAGERELATARAKLPPAVAKPAKVASRPRRGTSVMLRKEIKTLEQTIAQLDEQKRALNAQLLESTDAAEALRLHNEVAALTAQLAEAEERWCQLQEEIEVGAFGDQPD